jgi:hypothetical protein
VIPNIVSLLVGAAVIIVTLRLRRQPVWRGERQGERDHSSSE